MRVAEKLDWKGLRQAQVHLCIFAIIATLYTKAFPLQANGAQRVLGG
jgi:hypothetical protein